MAIYEAVRLGLKWSKKDGWMKTVNTKVQPLNGIGQGLEMWLGSWNGPLNFKVVWGMDFMRQVSATVMLALNSVWILKNGSLCIIPVLEEKTDGTRQLSAMQLTKGVKKGEPTGLALMEMEDEPDCGGC